MSRPAAARRRAEGFLNDEGREWDEGAKRGEGVNDQAELGMQQGMEDFLFKRKGRCG